MLNWQKLNEENSENIINNGTLKARKESQISCVNYIMSKKYDITNPIERLNKNNNLLMIAPPVATPSLLPSPFGNIKNLSTSPFFNNCRTNFIKTEMMNSANLNLTTSIFRNLLKSSALNGASEAMKMSQNSHNSMIEQNYQNMLNYSIKIRNGERKLPALMPPSGSQFQPTFEPDNGDHKKPKKDLKRKSNKRGENDDKNKKKM